jgi:UDP-glucose 4,6-dehydratase
MNLLVTGGCGFIGSNFINYYFDKYTECKIVNIDALYYCANINNVRQDIRSSERYKFVKGNICSYDLVLNTLLECGITHIVHFAAQSHVDNSFHVPLQYTQDNIVGTHTLLEATRKYDGIKLFVHVSTDEVYGESVSDMKTEGSILCPTNPYAASKAGAELIVMSYYHSYRLPIIITRGNNVYGPLQYPEKLIPKFISLLSSGKRMTIHGDGKNLRSFIHVHDVVTAFEVVLRCGVVGEIYNIGADEEYSVIDIAGLLVSKMLPGQDLGKHIEWVDDRPFNDRRYYISSQKLRDLGWRTTMNFDKCISELIKLCVHH